MTKTTLKRCQLLVKPSPIHGYGVFAEQRIEANETIEECHILIAKKEDPACGDYYFYGQDNTVLPLGLGSIYNHSDNPSASFVYDPERQLLIFRALREINQGEEIFVSYGKSWFTSRQIKPLQTSWHFKCRQAVFGMPSLIRFLVVLGAVMLVASYQ